MADSSRRLRFTAQVVLSQGKEFRAEVIAAALEEVLSDLSERLNDHGYFVSTREVARWESTRSDNRGFLEGDLL
jgi:hypothetical protein